MEEIEMFRQSQPFQTWWGRMERQTEVVVEKVVLSDLSMFGPRVGFSKFTAIVRDRETGVMLPGICVLRGDSVAVLIILSCGDYPTEPKRLLLTRQFRVPVGEEILEVVAGMMDGNNGVMGKAIDEVREEAGILLESNQLVSLTDWAGLDKGVVMSGGLVDERIHLYSCEVTMTLLEIEQLENQLHGVKEEGEQIRLTTIPLNEAYMVGDAKLLSALYLYQEMSRNM
jgi:hypothetical protein